MSFNRALATKLAGLREIWQFTNRWQLLMSRAVFREPLNIYRLGDVVFLEDHDAGDANGARHVLTSPMYRDLLALIRLPTQLRVIDIGVNNGGFGLLLKHLGFEVRFIRAVEMNPTTFQRMRFNLELNFQRGVTCINAAVCGKSGTTEVFVGSGSTGDSMYAKPEERRRPVAVRSMTLNEVLDEAADLVKIDIEGSEFEIFDGDAWNHLCGCASLLIEIHPQYGSVEAVLRRLSAAGFDKAGSIGDVHCFVNRRRSDPAKTGPRTTPTEGSIGGATEAIA